MPRTTEDLVRGIIDNSAAIDVTPFITAANLLVDKIAQNDSLSLLVANDLKAIETWLAAHFYAHRDQLLTSKSTSGASGSFQGQTGMHFESTTYGQTAMLIDVTGYLAKLQQQARTGRQGIRMLWLGSTETESDGYSSPYKVIS